MGGGFGLLLFNMLKIRTDTRDVDKGLQSLSRSLSVGFEKGLSGLARKVEQRARTRHRYKDRTRKLERATTVESAVDGLRAEISNTLAPYGKNIHEGFGTWAPDPFLADAVKEHETEFAREAERVIDDAIQKAGLA